MSNAYRRYEILLPRRFNDGSLVPKRQFTKTLLDLREKFGAVSCETQAIRGQWQFGGEVFQDELVRIFVDVDDQPEVRSFFREFKEQLKQRFQQLDIWMTSHPIDVV